LLVGVTRTSVRPVSARCRIASGDAAAYRVWVHDSKALRGMVDAMLIRVDWTLTTDRRTTGVCVEGINKKALGGVTVSVRCAQLTSDVMFFVPRAT
jgi:hypothetical protein